MRHIAAIPAVGLLAGAGCGLLAPQPPLILAFVLISSSVAGAMFGWALRRPMLLAAAVALGFFTGGALLAADAWQRAWRPSLRVAFEERAREERVHAAAEGRTLPEDDEAFVVVEGTLRSDASPGASGVSLSLAVDGLKGRDRRDGPDGQEGKEREGFSRAEKEREGKEREGFSRASGGILVTVVGTLAADRMHEWRTGRRVRLPVQLRRPSRYLDPGVPDHERALARRGDTLVGTVKSGVSSRCWHAPPGSTR